MKKKYFSLASLVLLGGISIAQKGQVGINTNNPLSSIHIKDVNAGAALSTSTPTINTGIIVPKVTVTPPVSSGTDTPIEGQMVYLDGTGFIFFKDGSWHTLVAVSANPVRVILNNSISLLDKLNAGYQNLSLEEDIDPLSIYDRTTSIFSPSTSGRYDFSIIASIQAMSTNAHQVAFELYNVTTGTVIKTFGMGGTGGTETTSLYWITSLVAGNQYRFRYNVTGNFDTSVTIKGFNVEVVKK